MFLLGSYHKKWEWRAVTFAHSVKIGELNKSGTRLGVFSFGKL
jgi:hypothetical protein